MSENYIAKFSANNTDYPIKDAIFADYPHSHASVFRGKYLG